MGAEFGCVILTQGNRPQQLQKAINSCRGQAGVSVDLVVVGNGFNPANVTDAKSIYLSENLGIPAGRNAGVAHVTGDYLLFLDDDVFIPDEDFLMRASNYFKNNLKTSLVQPQPQDPTGLDTPRRWIPRILVLNENRSSKAFSLWEGATLVRREDFEKVKGWPADFYYGHEGVALVWKIWNLGGQCDYRADLVVSHPLADPAERHKDFYFYNARNRYWLARRYLPMGFRQLYLINWFVISKLRLRKNSSAWTAWKQGWNEGKLDSAPLETIKFITLLRMLRWGRLLVV